MKHLYRIGIFVITCAIIGGLIYYLYGQFWQNVKDIGEFPQIYADQQDMQYQQQIKEEIENGTASETAVKKREFVSRQTLYLLKEYDSYTGEISVRECDIPRQYLGMTRQELEEELKIYEHAPSLEDVSKGLISVVLESFSSERIVIQKTYYQEPEKECYLLTVENNKIVVYYKNLNTLYCYTDIEVDQLPEKLQNELMKIKEIETEQELFTFLESYSS